MQIRPYQYGDRRAFDELARHGAEGGNQSEDQLNTRLDAIQKRGGKVWIIYQGNSATGYVFVDPVPSLKQVYDLDSSLRFSPGRKHLSSKLLDTILDELRGTEVKLLNHHVESLESPEAQFLTEYGFFVEHKEIKMQYDYSTDRADMQLPVGYEIKTFPMKKATARFRALYSLSFDGLPWNQPYECDSEVLAELVNPEDILFLMHRTRSIGFAWLRWPRSGVVELEPFGIIKSYQGRGLGRLFLEKVLAQAASLGAERMELGVWQENDRAIQLYQRAEFRQVGQTIYLAYSVESKAQMS